MSETNTVSPLRHRQGRLLITRRPDHDRCHRRGGSWRLPFSLAGLKSVD